MYPTFSEGNPTYAQVFDRCYARCYDNTRQALSAQNDQVPLRNCSCFETDLGELLVLSRL